MAINPDSILDSVKKVLQVPFDYDVYDLDIMMHINSVFFTLQQLGIGPADGFQIEDADTTWENFLGVDPMLNVVKSYTALRVKLIFDPPPNSFTQTALKEQISEYEWRINVYREGLVYAVPIPATTENVVDGGEGLA